MTLSIYEVWDEQKNHGNYWSNGIRAMYWCRIAGVLGERWFKTVWGCTHVQYTQISWRHCQLFPITICFYISRNGQTFGHWTLTCSCKWGFCIQYRIISVCVLAVRSCNTRNWRFCSRACLLLSYNQILLWCAVWLILGWYLLHVRNPNLWLQWCMSNDFGEHC